MIPTWITIFATIGIITTVCIISTALALMFGAVAKEFNPSDEVEYHE